MTHHPFDLDELDRSDLELASVARELEATAAAEPGVPPMDLAARIQTRIDVEPVPAGFLGLGRLFGSPSSMRAFAVAAVAVLAVVGALTFARLVGLVREIDVGSTPRPSIVLPTESPSPSPSPTPTPSPSPSPSESPSDSPSASPDETDEPDETPEPSESEDDDNSGPGGGGSDSSGPGGGDDDETPEPSDDDSSGPGGGG